MPPCLVKAVCMANGDLWRFLCVTALQQSSCLSSLETLLFCMDTELRGVQVHGPARGPRVT